MLPEVVLKDINREDIDRVAWWLRDPQLVSSWFGHYGCDNSSHLGYDPVSMVEATDLEWESFVNDSKRVVFSIYDGNDVHIGECQILPGLEDVAEISLVIGPKENWRQGYGTATIIKLLDKAFGNFGFGKVCVRVPSKNVPALKLFEKLGFVQDMEVETCSSVDTGIDASRLMLLTPDRYSVGLQRRNESLGFQMLTVTGLLGSPCEEIAEIVSDKMRWKLIESQEIINELSLLLKSSPNEIASFEEATGSFWSQLLAKFVVSVDGVQTYDYGHQDFPYIRSDWSHGPMGQAINNKSYSDALGRVIMELGTTGNVIINGYGSHHFKFNRLEKLDIFVDASIESRINRIAISNNISKDQASEVVRSSDRVMRLRYENLLGVDISDTNGYNILFNMDNTSVDEVVQVISRALNPISVTPSTFSYSN